MSKGRSAVLSWNVRVLVSVLALAAIAGGTRLAGADDAYWRSLAVEAELDADGVLHVRERQHMVLTGRQNGGERRFTLRPGQQVVLHGMTRIDPATGARREMVAGDLDEVDEFAWVTGSTLRWRSRRPDDPSFDRTPLVYELDYSWYGALQPRDATYVLDHDFVFRDRVGPIEEATAALRVDPAWNTDGPREQTWRSGRLLPGMSLPVVVYLTRAENAGPVGLGASPQQARLLLALVAVPLLLLVQLVASEWIRGRFAPLTPQDATLPGWLESNVFHLPAEVVGAVWDRGVGPDEVAAVVARLSAEGKITTRVDGAGIMSMSLKVGRDAFQGYERELIDGFFFDERTETSTAEIRERYKSSGFDPTSRIKAGLDERVQQVVGPSARRPWLPLWLPTLVAWCGGMFLLWRVPGPTESRLVPILAIGLPTLLVGGFGVGLAATWRDRIDRGLLSMVSFLIPMGLLVAYGWLLVTRFEGVPTLSGMMSDIGGLSPDGCLGATLVVLAFVNSMVNNARSRERRQGVALRKRLASARRYFQDQLDRPEPSLRDAWFPYVLAFGLDDDAQRWFRAHGGQSSASTPSWSHSTSSSSGGGGGSWSGGGSTGWSGGGGAFGGAGASASWAAAASTLSAGVAAPSSGGSSGGGGGGGGGGSSSGGGGGGTW